MGSSGPPNPPQPPLGRVVSDGFDQGSVTQFFSEKELAAWGHGVPITLSYDPPTAFQPALNEYANHFNCPSLTQQMVRNYVFANYLYVCREAKAPADYRSLN